MVAEIKRKTAWQSFHKKHTRNLETVGIGRENQVTYTWPGRHEAED